MAIVTSNYIRFKITTMKINCCCCCVLSTNANVLQSLLNKLFDLTLQCSFLEDVNQAGASQVGIKQIFQCIFNLLGLAHLGAAHILLRVRNSLFGLQQENTDTISFKCFDIKIAISNKSIAFIAYNYSLQGVNRFSLA